MNKILKLLYEIFIAPIRNALEFDKACQTTNVEAVKIQPFWASVKKNSPWCEHIAPLSLVNPNYKNDPGADTTWLKLLSAYGDGSYVWKHYYSEYCDECGAKKP